MKKNKPAVIQRLQTLSAQMSETSLKMVDALNDDEAAKHAAELMRAARKCQQWAYDLEEEK